jgi:hypothetical protein
MIRSADLLGGHLKAIEGLMDDIGVEKSAIGEEYERLDSLVKKLLYPVIITTPTPAPVVPKTFFLNEQHELPRQRPRKNPATSEVTDAPALGSGAMEMLRMFVTFEPHGLTRTQAATLSGVSYKSSSVDTYLSRLRAKGFITTGDSIVRATLEGQSFVVNLDGPVHQRPRSGPEMLHFWRDRARKKLGGRCITILEHLVAVGRVGLDLGTLAVRAGVSPTSSSMDTYMSRLRSNDLVRRGDERGMVAAADWFFT